jgi:hypothetical protein
MEETRNHSGIVLNGTAHLDGHIDSGGEEYIDFTLSEYIHMDQTSTDRDGNSVENEIIIRSKWQAMAVIQIIRAMAAAKGWKI